MFSGIFFYLLIVLVLFGIGDFIGVATKARISGVFVTLIMFLILFVSGVLPPNIIDLAGLSSIGKFCLCYVVFGMGTTLNLKQLAAEWRTVVTAVLSMVVLLLSSVALVPLIGYSETVVALPVVNGGIVAAQMMTTGAMEHGLHIAAALGAILYAVQKFFGTPVASFFGLRFAKELLETYRRTGVNPYKTGESAEEKAKGPTFFERHKKYYGNFLCIAIVGFFCWIATILGKYTGLSATVWSLILGAAFATTGYIPPKILDFAKCSGFFNMGVFASIIPALAKVKLEDLIVLSYDTIVIFVIVLVVLFVCFYILPLWKILGSRNLAMGVSVMQMLGFPITYLVANEVIIASGDTEEEKQVVSDALMPKYLVGGFSTVTTFSVILASIAQTLL